MLLSMFLGLLCTAQWVEFGRMLAIAFLVCISKKHAGIGLIYYHFVHAYLVSHPLKLSRGDLCTPLLHLDP